MPDPAMQVSQETIEEIESLVSSTLENGSQIRKLLGQKSGTPPWTENWEVAAAVEALHIFASRWTIEILSALYITGPKRFNELKFLLKGISSRTLSDKLKMLAKDGLVNRLVSDGPPVKVQYVLSDHGTLCGKLLSPLVAHLKLHLGSVVSNSP